MKREIDEIADLLDRPIWQMSGREFLMLTHYAVSGDQTTPISQTLCTGVRALADYLGCCEATIYSLKKEGILDTAIVSKIGKKTVFDGNKARELANAYKLIK